MFSKMTHFVCFSIFYIFNSISVQFGVFRCTWLQNPGLISALTLVVPCCCWEQPRSYIIFSLPVCVLLKKLSVVDNYKMDHFYRHGVSTRQVSWVSLCAAKTHVFVLPVVWYSAKAAVYLLCCVFPTLCAWIKLTVYMYIWGGMRESIYRTPVHLW